MRQKGVYVCNTMTSWPLCDITAGLSAPFRPLVRSLSSLQLFQHAMSRHDVMFMYVGATSPLKVRAAHTNTHTFTYVSHVHLHTHLRSHFHVFTGELHVSS